MKATGIKGTRARDLGAGIVAAAALFGIVGHPSNQAATRARATSLPPTWRSVIVEALSIAVGLGIGCALTWLAVAAR